ncbi:MAG: ABC transporter permease [Dehalococcoidia bacterium]|nr:ABC transporter permease [Dehalococcoidia bacterium]
MAPAVAKPVVHPHTPFRLAAPRPPPLAWWRTLLEEWLPPLCLLLGLIGLWELLVRALDVQRWLLPPPSAIAAELGDSGQLLMRHTWITVQEVLAGLGAALAVGVGLALAIAYWRTVARAIYPIVIASQTVPIIAIAPLLLVWVGYGLQPKMIVVALISFFPVVVNMVDGLRAVDPEMTSMLRSLGAGRWQAFQAVHIPSSLPYLFSGMKVAAAVSVIGAVIGEWVGASSGLGYLMVQASPRFQTDLVFAAIVILSAMGIALFLFVGAVERLVIPWHSAIRAARDTTRNP